MLRYFVSNYTDPYINIAIEEYLFKNFDCDFLFIYRNANCVIVGKHQNTLAEINYLFIQQNKIDVVRRLSGGGAVFHDEGNVNFTYIKSLKQGESINYTNFLTPIVSKLNDLGIDAYIDKNYNILVSDFKVSGNAQHIYKNRVLQHSTLLFSCNLDNLYQSLTPNQNRYIDRAVKSKFSKVINISDFFSRKISIDNFMAILQDSILNNHPNSIKLELTETDLNKINILKQEKYLQWSWNYAYSPNYTLNGEIVDLEVKYKMLVENGKIIKIDFDTFFEFFNDLMMISYAFTNAYHEENTLENIIKDLKLTELPKKISCNSFVKYLF